MLINNLYENMIEKNSVASNELKVITGYGSANFVKRVLLDFSDLKVTLFIGMSLEGISQNNHKNFLLLSEEFQGRLEVYYQINKPNTHIKLYSWYYKRYNIINYAGSANFTENGFFNNKEILISFNDSVENVFEEQKKNSLLCNDVRISEFIDFYDDESIEQEDVSSEDSTDENLLTIRVEEQTVVKTKVPSTRSLLGDKRIIDKFTIPILLKTETSSATTGINAWNRGKQQPYLKQSPNYPFSKYFPLDKKIRFITDDNKILVGIIRGSKDKQLEFDPNIYEYIAERIGLYEKRPIIFKDLVHYGESNVVISKITDTEYLFDFQKSEKNL
ncbi:restriction endonuclease PLD domain-containing protein [Marinilactibacillus sp. XAAS-LB27]|uniref:restriction endonuclease PLD domain-containing protein n=1 Tax=Marinilactibacillus sp. XAAS-LB27 TaxID=3114538 RepID=UPI002E171BBB|nr:restriction endonuclease PLD domain-containing protein [Marinilactibacillus sp. XAAS-LB27]